MYNTMSVPMSVLCPWIKGTFSVGEGRLVASITNTIFGIIPAGKETRNIPLSNISAVVLNRYYNTGSLLAGCAVCLFGLTTVVEPSMIPVAIFMFIFGVWLVASSIRTEIKIQNNGLEFTAFIPFYAASKAAEIKTMIDEAVANINEDNRTI